MDVRSWNTVAVFLYVEVPLPMLLSVLIWYIFYEILPPPHMYFTFAVIYIYIYTVKPAENGPPIYRKPGQTENKFRNGVISHVK
jgi:hypothetical protein